MFRTVEITSQDTVTVSFAGEPIRVPASFTVAAALLASGVPWTRLSVGERAPRGPFCMMGVCFECQVAIDGIGGQRACQILVREGMRIERQSPLGEPLDVG